MLKLLMFDAFRTIFDTYGTHTGATKLILEREGVDVEFNSFHDKWDELIMERWRTPSEFKLLWPIFEECLVETFEHFGISGYDAPAGIKIWLDLVADAPPFPETCAVVGPLIEKFDNAIVSNSDNFEMELCMSRLGLKFGAVFTSEDVRSYKPRPELFEAAMSRFGVSADECLMIGDSIAADIRGANNLGIKCVWINRTGKKIPEGGPSPDFILPDLNGLTEIVERLSQR